MSLRFYLCSGGLVVASVIAGLAIGGYATRMPVPETMPALVDTGAAIDAEYAAGPGDTAPTTVVCRGCGPTLAERRMATDQANLDADGYMAGSRDPVVIDYMREDVGEPSSPPGLAAVQRPVDSGAVLPPPAAHTLTDAPPAITQP